MASKRSKVEVAKVEKMKDVDRLQIVRRSITNVTITSCGGVNALERGSYRQTDVNILNQEGSFHNRQDDMGNPDKLDRNVR
jgi:hypothetical protein